MTQLTELTELTQENLNNYNRWHNLLPYLPLQLLETVYLFDPTYKRAFDIVLEEMLFDAYQHDDHLDFLVEQELDKNTFEFFIDDELQTILGNNYRTPHY
jgi:hypothetical protein